MFQHTLVTCTSHLTQLKLQFGATSSQLMNVTSRYNAAKPYLPYTVGDQVWLHVPAVKTGRSKKFSSQWHGPYTVLEKISPTNYHIKLIVSPVKDMVVHHNKLKLCYGIPEHSTLTQAPLTLTQHSYTDVVCHTEPEPTGGYASSSNNSFPMQLFLSPLDLDATVDPLVVTVILCHLNL